MVQYVLWYQPKLNDISGSLSFVLHMMFFYTLPKGNCVSVAYHRWHLRYNISVVC